MSNTYNFIINSFQEVEDLRFFINFLHSKKKKIVFFCQKPQINEQLKIFINKNKINNILNNNFEAHTFLHGQFPIEKINNINNIVVTTHPYSLFFGEKKNKFLFVFFQSLLDSLMILNESDLKNIDLFFFHTKYWKKILNKYYKKKINSINNKTYYYGFPRINRSTHEQIKIRKIYNINTNKKIVLLLYGNFNKVNSIFNSILNFNNQIERFCRFFFNMLKFKRICIQSFKILLKNIQITDFINKIEKIKKENDCYLILKLRKKSIPPISLLSMADKVIIDNPYYTFASDNLVKISNFIIHFSSTAILSCIFYGKKNLSIVKPVDETLLNNNKILFFYNYIRLKKNNVFNYRDLTSKILFEDFIKLKSDINFDLSNLHINKINREAYIKKFIYNKSESLNINQIYKIITNKINEKNRI